MKTARAHVCVCYKKYVVKGYLPDSVDFFLTLRKPQREGDFRRRAKFSADKGSPNLVVGAMGSRGRGGIVRLPALEGTPNPRSLTKPVGKGLSLGGSLLGGSLTGLDAGIRSEVAAEGERAFIRNDTPTRGVLGVNSDRRRIPSHLMPDS